MIYRDIHGIYSLFAKRLLPVAGKVIVSLALGRLGVARVEKVIMTKKPHPEARPLGAFKIGERELG